MFDAWTQSGGSDTSFTAQLVLDLLPRQQYLSPEKGTSSIGLDGNLRYLFLGYRFLDSPPKD